MKPLRSSTYPRLDTPTIIIFIALSGFALVNYAAAVLSVGVGS